MERIGLVNKYLCNDCNNYHLTINFNVGTTPFSTLCPICNLGTTFSQMYQFHQLGEVLVEYCWYRPTRRELKTYKDDSFIRHVLKGGLLRGKVGDVVPLIDQVEADWDTLEWYDYCKDIYGIRPTLDPFFPIDRSLL